MSSSSPHLSEELFQCSVCLDVFTQPVSLPCGHTFCQSCVLTQWTASGASHCPKCSRVFQETPELCINAFAREMAEQIRKQRGQRPSDHHSVISHKILCDMCPKDKSSLAVKSCLVCVASYCEEHVTSHTSRFIKHALVQPQRRMDKRICRIHERPLELYCKYDQTCVCVQCTNTEHDTHHTIPVEREWEERKIQLLKTQSDIKRMIKERKRKVKEFRNSIKLSKETTDSEMAYSLEVFTTLLQFIEKRQNDLIQSMKQKQKAAEKKVEKLIGELEMEISKLNTAHSELEQLSCSEDHLQLIQSFPKPSVVPQCKSWSQISVQTSQGMGLLREALIDTEDLMNSRKYPNMQADHNHQNNIPSCAQPLIGPGESDLVSDFGFVMDSDQRWAREEDFDHRHLLTQQTDSGYDELIRPKKIYNPIKASKSHRELHRELIITHKRGAAMEEKPELQKVLEQRTRIQALKQQKIKEVEKSPLEQELLKRQMRLEKLEREAEKQKETSQGAPEFIRVKENLKSTAVTNTVEKEH